MIEMDWNLKKKKFASSLEKKQQQQQQIANYIMVCSPC